MKGCSRPSLTAWVIAGLIVAGAMTALLVAPVPDRATKAQTMNLQRLHAAAAGEPHIVALGSSKMMYAMAFDAAFARRIPLMPAARFTRLTWLGPKTDDMLEPLAAMQDTAVTVLLLEAELLAMDHTPTRGVFAATQRMRFTLRRWLWRRSPEAATDESNARDNHGLEAFAAAGECRWQQSPARRQEYARSAAGRQVATDEESSRYVALLRPLQAAGIRVVLLDVPRAPWAEALLSPGFRQAYSDRLLRIARQHNFELWTPPEGLLGDAEYCDAGHLSETGRQRYERWLAPKLAAALGGSSDG